VIRRACVVALAAASLLLGGCSSSDPAKTEVELRPRWQETTLPTPPGPPGRLAVRDATTCDGTWYVVGAVLGEAGASRPAAWTSSDGRTWRTITTAPTDYYARRAILYSAACQGGQLVAVGAKSGGAHGNPRTATWRLREDGALQNVEASFELYGGPNALSVNRVAGGPGGWVVAGARSSGAAVWVAPDAIRFHLVDHDPELASDATRTTSALDVVHDGDAWTAVGRAQVTGRVAQVPQAWVSTDGAQWSRQEVPVGTEGFADLERVAREGDGLLAVGIRDDRFGTWRRTGHEWRATESFGAIASETTGAPFVSGLAAASGTALVSASDGAVFRLWARAEGAGGWRRAATPTQPVNNGEDQLTVATDGVTALLLSDNGTSGRVWTTAWNTLGR
jgi:hypothetical protein